MDPEILINSPESDEDLFNIGYPPSSGQQTDLSQASERSRVRSAISVPHTSRHRSHSSSPNEIPPTPDRSQASSTPPARVNSRGQQIQPAPISPPPAACLTRSPRPLAAAHPTRLSDGAVLRNGARTSTFPEGKRHPLSLK
ncbi:hypothetical protein OYC64_016960 [Pagothenia borchgrevinki]|uniref:Uncharacterized protein n=1 Tax=Pagothenia borchgrevinki TaxID=8213 RepID=A0ABD2HKV6_PAGBO